ncbi:MAG: hypothetical protein PHH14_05450 [Candidatus Margulisbacteria bacterium]|nr:hypothetical protein [Candidatus Margulisiibacteriota bacterium]
MAECLRPAAMSANDWQKFTKRYKPRCYDDAGEALLMIDQQDHPDIMAVAAPHDTNADAPTSPLKVLYQQILPPIHALYQSFVFEDITYDFASCSLAEQAQLPIIRQNLSKKYDYYKVTKTVAELEATADLARSYNWQYFSIDLNCSQYIMMHQSADINIMGRIVKDKLVSFIDQARKKGQVLVFSGLPHNDISPNDLVRLFSFGVEYSKQKGLKYTAVDIWRRDLAHRFFLIHESPKLFLDYDTLIEAAIPEKGFMVINIFDRSWMIFYQ